MLENSDQPAESPLLGPGEIRDQPDWENIMGDWIPENGGAEGGGDDNDDFDTLLDVVQPRDSTPSPPPYQAETDRSPDFVSLLSLLDNYFHQSVFPTDGLTPRVLEPNFPSLALQGSSLGHGRTFSVWLLHYRGSVFAVKQPRLAERSYTETLRAILVELRVLTLPPLVGHENIAGLVGYGWEYRPYFESQGGIVPFLTVEYCEKGTLSALIASSSSSSSSHGGLTRETKNGLILDIARGLLALHEVGVAHCDVRCENVLIKSHPDPKRKYIAKLTDFGSALTDAGDGSGFAAGGDNPPQSYPCHAPEAFGFVRWENYRFLDVYSYGLVALSVLLETANPFEGFFASLQASTSSESLPVDARLGREWTDAQTDTRRKVSNVKSEGMTEAAMLWLVSQPTWKTKLDVAMTEELVKHTLKSRPQERSLRDAARAIAETTGVSVGNESDEDIPTNPAGLSDRFPWQPVSFPSRSFSIFQQRILMH